MPFFIIFPPAPPHPVPDVAGPFLRLEDAEAANSGHRMGVPGRVVETADRAAALRLVRQTWPRDGEWG